MKLDPETRLLVQISAALAAGDGPELEEKLAEAAAGGCGRRQVDEALLQSYLFLGYPAALTALRRWRAIAGAPAEEADPLARPERIAEWTERGGQVCARVYGRAYEKLRANVARAHPAMDR